LGGSVDDDGLDGFASDASDAMPLLFLRRLARLGSDELRRAVGARAV